MQEMREKLLPYLPHLRHLRHLPYVLRLSELSINSDLAPFSGRAGRPSHHIEIFIVG
jgi:hypothetical protein